MLVLKTKRSPLDAVGFGPSGRTLAAVGGSSSARVLTVWSLDSGEVVGRYDARYTNWVPVRPVPAAGGDGFLVPWTPAAPNRSSNWFVFGADGTLAPHPLPTGFTPALFACPRTGRTLVVAGRRGGMGVVAAEFEPGGRPVQQWHAPLDADWHPVAAVFDPDADTVAVAETNTAVNVIEGAVAPTREYRLPVRQFDTGRVTAERRGTGSMWGMGYALSPDAAVLASQYENAVRLVRFDGGPPLPPIVNDARRHFTGLAFHPSGRVLAAASNDATVRLFDAASGTPAATFTWNVGRMRSVAFSPDGTLAAAGSDTGRVMVWDVDL